MAIDMNDTQLVIAGLKNRFDHDAFCPITIVETILKFGHKSKQSPFLREAIPAIATKLRFLLSRCPEIGLLWLYSFASQTEQGNASRGPVALLISDWMCALAVRWLLPCSIGLVSRPSDPKYSRFSIFALDLVNVDLELELRHPEFEEEYVDVAVPLIPLLAERGSSMDNAREWLSGLLHARNVVPVPGMMPRRPSPDVAFNNDYFNAPYQMFLAQQSQQCMHIT
ncbi:hypothetical protein C8J57DRAFT_1233566 [Mycena rebaudengoi]|nr:hypothetical protein C8J57DRAFT_1233566 [Mycena rebaudengoi]